MWNQEGDVEEALLFSKAVEEARWAVIRKVYASLTLQILTAVAAIVAAVHPIYSFFSTTGAGLAVYISIVVILLIVASLLGMFQVLYPHNFILLGIFTLCFGLVLGLATSFSSDPVILEAAIAAAVVVVSLTAYTFWAAKRGRDLGFLLPFLITIVITLALFTIFQILFPMSRFPNVIYSGLGVLVFCAYVIYYTNTLYIHYTLYSFHPYIWASVNLYHLDVINIFLRWLQRFRAGDR